METHHPRPIRYHGSGLSCLFSRRLSCTLTPNQLTSQLSSLRAQGEHILDLTESNPTRAGLRYPASLLFSLTDPRGLLYEPDPRGLLTAREAVCEYYGHTVTPSRVILTASTSEAYGFLFKLLADPGDEVLIPRPSYPLFEFLAELESVHAKPYWLRYDGQWWMDLESLTQQITGRTRAIVIVNPNNPTGSFLKQAEWAELCRLCRRHDLAVISDEVFADFAFDPDPARIPSLVTHHDILSFSLSGLSKIAGLPQMKLGWIVINGPDELRRRAHQQLELISDTYLSVSTPGQWAAPSLLAARHHLQEQLTQRTRRNLEQARHMAAPGTPLDLLHTEGGWYTTLRIPRVRSEQEWALLLLNQHRTLVQPGYFFDFASEAYLVLSLLTPESVFAAGTTPIAQAVSAVLA